MKIVVSGSMQFSDQMLEVAEELRKLGHEPVLSSYVERYAGKSHDQIERLKLEDKYNDRNALIEYWDFLQDVDALLMLNYDKHGIKHYVGGNAFLEMGFAYVLNRPIYFLHPLPDMPYYGTEIIAMKPIIIGGDLSKIQTG
jgi:hypothetical protein